MINIDFLQYLVTYAETQNLTKASETLHVSQSALTRAMQRIEGEVGVPLFRRSANRLELTDTGRELVKYARKVLDAEAEMVSHTAAYYHAASRLSVGTTAPGPLLKYGQRLYGAVGDKELSTRIDALDALLKGLESGLYDLVFVHRPVEAEGLVCRYAFCEKLYVSVPKTHFVAGMTEGVRFGEIDGQSFLVADNLGLWKELVERHLPRSKFFEQNYDNLGEIVQASTIPSFATNVTIPLSSRSDRVQIPILDEAAAVDFWAVYPLSRGDKVAGVLSLLDDRD